MEITREVYDDLVTLAESGMASEATMRLMEQCRVANPDWRTAEARPAELPRAAVPDTVEREALSRTRRLLTARAWTMGAAIAFTALPMSFVFRNGTPVFVLYRQEPTLAAVLYGIGLIFWSILLWINRRLWRLGLGSPGSSMWRWIVASAAILTPGAVLVTQAPRQIAMLLFGLLAAIWAVRLVRYGR